MGMQFAAWLGVALLLAGGPVAMAASSGGNPPLKALMESDRRFLEQIGPPPPEPVAEQRPPPEPAIDAETATHFLQAYVKAAGQADADAEATYFADSVEFYERGKLGRKALRKELAKARKPPRQRQTWMGLQGLNAEGDDRVKARFTVLKGDPTEAKRAEVREATIRKLPGGGLRIMALHEANPAESGTHPKR